MDKTAFDMGVEDALEGMIKEAISAGLMGRVSGLKAGLAARGLASPARARRAALPGARGTTTLTKKRQMGAFKAGKGQEFLAAERAALGR